MIARLIHKRLVPVGVIQRTEDAIPIAEALLAGGLDMIEVTLRTAEAEACIRAIRQRFPQMLVGAGTILEPGQIDRCLEAGAQFGVSPGLNENVVRHAQERGLPFVPGVMTPSEVERALALGCRLLKFFPAEAAGGIKMLQALAGPYAHTGIKFIPLGGIHSGNAPGYAALPVVAAIGGSWLLERQLIAEKNWPQITRLVSEALALVAGDAARRS
jgi:2-dehydro-3-deoxyphosphogluconate aldolase/(4S)-4-hydroxy-2-oxoglutarate aldolase